MADTAFDRFGLAGLARATQQSLDYKKWGQAGKAYELDHVGPPKQVLDKLIEAEIIPRLMLVNRGATLSAEQDQSQPTGSLRFDADHVNDFAQRTVTAGAEELVAEIDRLMESGASHEDVLLKLLAPAARRLGALWEEDLCDFADVTIGLMKMHRILEHVNEDTPCGMGAGGVSPRVLMAPAPGEMHVFGVVMVGEFFTRAGWRVRCESTPDAAHIAATVSEDHYDVVGLSVSSELNTKSLRAAIKLIRARSLNRQVFVLVGGNAFNEDLGLAKRVGADATATDGVRAVVTAQRLVNRLSRVE
jgi:methanogenic corrinoid protein MtbC1